MWTKVVLSASVYIASFLFLTILLNGCIAAIAFVDLWVRVWVVSTLEPLSTAMPSNNVSLFFYGLLCGHVLHFS